MGKLLDKILAKFAHNIFENSNCFSKIRLNSEVTGITLSEDQLAYGRKLNAETPNVHLMLQDAMTMTERTDFPKFAHITSLEMAEHVGIKRYGKFPGTDL